MSQLETEAGEWIQAVTGQRFSGEGFADSLKDGVLLCQCVRGWAAAVAYGGACVGAVFSPPPPPPLSSLANRLKPGSVLKINDPATMPFKKMEVRRAPCRFWWAWCRTPSRAAPHPHPPPQNIANYLKAVRALGMKEFEMFGTPGA